MNAENHETIYEVSRMLEYSAGQQILLEFEETLTADLNYTLIIKYTTRLSRELEGFYLSSYTTSKGDRRRVRGPFWACAQLVKRPKFTIYISIFI